MQYIDKKLTMPISVEQWKNQSKPKDWADIHQNGNKLHYETLKEQLRQEQKGLCCYCCQILEKQATVEHLKSRSKFPKLTFDYQNLLLSCQESNQCDNAKGSDELDLTPLMVECDTEITLKTNGELKPDNNSERAEQAIKLLNLNNPDLRQRRERAIKDLFDIDKQLDKENLESMFEFMDIEEAELYRYILNKLVLNGYS